MATELGILLRHWRLDKGVNMFEMASSVGISTAFLSAIENGKKKITDKIISKIIDYFDLSEENVKSLHNAIDKSNKKVTISLENINQADQDGVLAFARNLKL